MVIAQIRMHRAAPENLASSRWAMALAQSQGAQVCGYS
jgi:hypothetical protein